MTIALPGWENLSQLQQAEVRAHVAGLNEPEEDTYPAPKHGWCCFHCGQTFFTVKAARLHFGETPKAKPVCAPDRAGLADLIARYFRAEIGRLMQQAEHWAENAKPLAVHHRLQKADAYFQIVALFERHLRGGWGDSFDYMALHLDRAEVKPHGAYPYSAELHRYNDVQFVTSELDRLAARCTNHPDRPTRANLDGDELCQECADAWVRGEGQHAAWVEAQEAEAKSRGEP